MPCLGGERISEVSLCWRLKLDTGYRQGKYMIQWCAIACGNQVAGARNTNLYVGTNQVRVSNENVIVDVEPTSAPRLTCGKSCHIEGVETRLNETECRAGTVMSFAESSLAIVVGRDGAGRAASVWLATNDPRTGLPNRNCLAEYSSLLNRRGEETILLAMVPNIRLGTVADLAIVGWIAKRLANQAELVGTLADVVVVVLSRNEQRVERFRRGLVAENDASTALVRKGVVIPLEPEFATAESMIDNIVRETKGSWVVVDG